MTYSSFQLRRLRVVQKGKPVYDQAFHAGVNIIRGENGSGKSTIADFIFYVLGGEFENWKTAAGACDQVQAEVATRGGILSLRRDIGKSLTPISLFYGSMPEAEQHGLDGWQTHPIRRSENRESFSQIFFRACGIPEAQSQGAANITMNQILRLLYSDQRTPAALLFRYEPFDTREIREAVGDLLCGLSVYELYETELKLRSLEKQFDEKNVRFSALLHAMPTEDALARPETIEKRTTELEAEYARLMQDIYNVDQSIDDNEVRTFLRQRAKAASKLQEHRQEISTIEQSLAVNQLEQADLAAFLNYLQDLSRKLPRAEASSEIVGNIEFTHCPACLSELSAHQGPGQCVVCGQPTDPEHTRSRYLQIKMDLEIQIRESRQLASDKESAQSLLERQLRLFRSNYQEMLSEYAIKYDSSTSPRESFVATRYRRLGQIDRERNELARLLERAFEIDALSKEKARLQQEISLLKDKQQAFEAASQKRRATALSLISLTARELIWKDLERQLEFRNAQNVAINFADNSVLVDGELNFAESSNVIVKNAAILALLLSAAKDEQFYHPRFALFDNIEDKGMQQDRSQNFQEVMVQASKAAPLDHQIILTTSMPNPKLDDPRLVIGPYYTHENRTLAPTTPTPKQIL